MAKTTSKTPAAKTQRKTSSKTTGSRRRTAAAGSRSSGKGKTSSGGGSKAALFYLIIIGMIVGISVLLVYTSVVFPKKLYYQIKSDIIDIYQPSACEDEQPHIPAVFKLDHIPSQSVQSRFEQAVRQHYGLETIFVRIADYDGKGINQIKFAKNGTEYGGVRDIYIYWDKNEDKKVSELGKTQITNTANKLPVSDTVKEKKKEKELPPAESKPAASKPTANKQTVKVSSKATAKDALLKEKNEIKTFEQRQKNISAPPKAQPPKVTQQPKPIEPVSRVVPQHYAKVTVIIDDVGYAYEATDKFLSVGVPITFAIIPETPHYAKYYRMITDNHYEAIIHIPMEPQKGPQYVESNALLTSMSDIEISTNVERFFMEMPACIGANNHMGSKAVADGPLMNVLIRTLAENNKLWVDSMTNAESLSHEFTSIYGMPDLHRDVFLDNQKDKASLEKSMDMLIIDAKKQGYAIGIGHAQTDLLPEVLLDYYNRRHELGVEFVGLRH